MGPEPMIMIFLMSVRLGMAWGGFLEGETTNAEPARDKPVRLIAQGLCAHGPAGGRRARLPRLAEEPEVTELLHVGGSPPGPAALP